MAINFEGSQRYGRYGVHSYYRVIKKFLFKPLTINNTKKWFGWVYILETSYSEDFSFIHYREFTDETEYILRFPLV